MARINRKTKGKKPSAEKRKWGEYLRQIQALPFVDKDNRVSWWGLPKRSACFGPAEMPYLRDDHNLEDASLLPDIALGMLCKPPSIGRNGERGAAGKLVAPVLPE